MLQIVSTAVQTAATTVSVTQALAILVVTCLAVRWATNKKWNLPPGPRGLPLVGNLLQFRGTTLFHKTLEWKEKYGPVVMFQAGPMPMVVLSSIEAISEAYGQRGADYADRPSMSSTDYICSQKDIVFSLYGEELKYRRKIAMLAIRQYLTGDQHTKRIDNLVRDTVKQMEDHKGSFDPHPYLSNIIFNLLHGICFGSTMKVDDPKYKKLLECLDRVAGNVTGFLEDFIPILSHFPTKTYRSYMKDIDYLLDHIMGHVNRRRLEFDENRVENLVDNILVAQKQVDEGDNEVIKSGFTDTHVGYLVMDVFLAGVETTKSTLDWIILALATHQDVQQKIHDEIDTVIGEDMPGRDRRLNLVYTEAVIMEVMRMYPVVAMNVPHKTRCDTQVLGYDIPANTSVVVNQISILNDSRHWDDPQTFKPERFIEADGQKLKPRPKSWIPFSVGPRNCIGEFLAKSNMLYTVAGLLQKLHFDLAPENGIPDFQPRDQWILCLCKPYKVVVTGRTMYSEI